MNSLVPRYLKILSFPAFLFLMTGCAIPFSTGNTVSVPPPPIEETYTAKSATLQDYQEGGIALGGVVIRQGVAVHRYPDLPTPGRKFDHFDQAEFWSSNCEHAFAQKASKLSLIPFFKFNDFVEDTLLTSVWARFAQGGHLSPEWLHSISSAEPGVQFVAFFRVEHDDISHDIDTAWVMTQNSGGGLGKVSGGGHDPGMVNNSNGPKIKRVVGLTMTVYDLKSATCVWEAGVIEDESDSIDPGDLNKYEGYQARQIETGQVMVVEEDEMPGAPAFNRVLDKCLRSIIKDLIRSVDPGYRRR